MYDYMKALQKRFDRQPHPELDAQVDRVQAELRRDMDAAGRKKLLRLLDAQNALLAESTLMSFTAGFKLVWDMVKELEADGLYSFEREEKNTSAIRQSRTFDPNLQIAHPRIKKDDFIRNHPFWYARLDSNQRPLESELSDRQATNRCGTRGW